MQILLSNDDGVHAEGLLLLYEELRRFANVVVVAPLDEKSSAGHFLTMHKPLRIHPIKKDFYGVSGGPADCIALGLKQLVRGPVDWVVSGINRGANLGQDVYYSGTVSAAREACIRNLPALSVSLAIRFTKQVSFQNLHYESAARVTAQILNHYKKSKQILPSGTFLNLNVPNLPSVELNSLKVLRQGFRDYAGDVVLRQDRRGKDYYWLGGDYEGYREDIDTDCYWLDRDYITLTPLKLDSTDQSYLNVLSQHFEPSFQSEEKHNIKINENVSR